MRNNVREIYEARIADLKEAHEARVTELLRLVDALAEQVEFLRMTGGTAKPVQAPVLRPMAPPVPMKTETLYVSDEEEDLRAMHDAGLIDVADLEAALRELGVEPDGPKFSPA